MTLTACGGTGSSRKNWGLAPFPQTQLAATTSNIDAEMAACPHFSSPSYFCHNLRIVSTFLGKAHGQEGIGTTLPPVFHSLDRQAQQSSMNRRESRGRNGFPCPDGQGLAASSLLVKTDRIRVAENHLSR
jgi:hypothetical protein